MNGDKPADVEDYTRWLRDEHEVHIGDRYRTHYEQAMGTAVDQINQSQTWQAILSELREADARFQVANRSVLLGPDAKSPVLKVKPYDSLIEKTFRLNVLNNHQWPEPPDGGWYKPPEWFSRVKDLVRTTIAVRYLDGVQLVLESLEDVCRRELTTFQYDLEARTEGYYAAHAVIEFECELPTMSWDTVRRSLMVEVQIATVVQGVVRELLHHHYERRRLREEPGEQLWQWQYESDEFATNYLGHLSHYLDGMIVGLRDRRGRS